MRLLKNLGMTALVISTVVAGSLSTTSSAEAHRWHRGGGWVGPAIVGGLAFGALAAAPRYGYGYGYGYYGCPRQVVGYTAWGRPIVRRVCY
jgi:hypothetical protein